MGALRTAAAVLTALLIVTGCDGNVDSTMNGTTASGGAGGGAGGSGGGAGGSGGTVGGTGGGGGTILMPDGGAADDGGTANGDGGACIPAVGTPPDGHHNPGANCLLCHDSNQMSPNLRWTVAGTLFDGISSSNPTAGATIEIIDAQGLVLTIPTATNGNFWTTTRVHFPLQVRASKCPANLVMPSPTFDGSCNACHVPGMRIHLP